MRNSTLQLPQGPLKGSAINKSKDSTEFLLQDPNTSNMMRANETLSESLFDDEDAENSTFLHEEMSSISDKPVRYEDKRSRNVQLDSTISLNDNSSYRSHKYDLQPSDDNMLLSKLECYQCKERFDKLSHLSIHMARHNKYASLRCIQCQSSFNFLHELSEHCRKHEYKDRKCLRCPEVFTNPNAYKFHLQSHITEIMHSETASEAQTQTSYTDTSYGRIKSSIENLLPEKIIPKIKEYHYCTLCSAFFTSKFRFSLHLSVHKRVAFNACDDISLCSSTDELGYGECLEF